MAVQPLSADDLAVALRAMELIGPVSALDVTAAICSPPLLERTIDGASTLTFDVADHRRELLRSGAFDVRSFAVVDGIHFELVKPRKQGDKINLTFEDAIVRALRRRDTPRTFGAGSANRQTIAAALAEEAGIRIDADPAIRPVVADAIERSADQEVTNSWDILGPLAEDIDWRRFSDGTGLLFGSDDWLMSRYPAVAIREHTNGVHNIDFDLDVGKPASSASVDLDADTWTLPPGLGVDILDHGPATGRWLIEKYSRVLTRTRGTLDLVRGQASLLEPPPSASGGNDSDGEAGEIDFLPDATSSQPAEPVMRSARAAEGGAAQVSSTRVRTLLAWCAAHAGTKYSWGKSGPDNVGYDCSGWVQNAMAAAGKPIAKPAAQQWNTARTKGRVITVEQAYGIPGALLFRANGERGVEHVAISAGNGQVWEARGNAYKNGLYPGRGRTWHYAAVWL